MRRSALTFILMAASGFVLGQEQKSTSASYVILEKQPAAMIVLPYSPSVVMDAMKEYEINAYKSKKNQSTAYQSFDNTALVTKIDKDASLVFQVGSMDNKNDQSVVYLMLNTPDNNGDYDRTVSQLEINDALSYLDNLSVAVGIIGLDRQIKEYTAQLRKVENVQGKTAKKCDRLEDKQVAMQEKLAQNKKVIFHRDQKIDKRLKESQEDLAFQKATADKHRADLALLTNQRNTFITNQHNSFR
jgi:hypothetical protein